jgi:hypothetical protein
VFALNRLTAGFYSLAKSTIGDFATEALHDTTKALTSKVGHFVATKIERHSDRAREHDQAEKENPRADGVGRLQDPSAKTYVEEFAERQRHAFAWHQKHVNLDILVGAVANGTKAELLALANELKQQENENLGSAFQEQLVFGWMNFCTRVGLAGEKLKEGPKSADNAVAATALQPRGQWLEVEGAIDVYVRLPEQLQGVGGLTLERMVADTGAGAVQILRNEGTRLMEAPVMRRVWLTTGDSLLSQTCAMVIYPNGSLSIAGQDPTLAAIGSMLPVGNSDLTVSTSFAVMGVQLLMNWLRPMTLEGLK